MAVVRVMEEVVAEGSALVRAVVARAAAVRAVVARAADEKVEVGMEAAEAEAAADEGKATMVEAAPAG